MYNPDVVALLQAAVLTGDYETLPANSRAW